MTTQQKDKLIKQIQKSDVYEYVIMIINYYKRVNKRGTVLSGRFFVTWSTAKGYVGQIVEITGIIYVIIGSINGIALTAQIGYIDNGYNFVPVFKF